MQGRTLVESLLAVAGIWLVARQVPDYATAVFLATTGDLPVSAAGPSVLGTQGLHFIVSIATGAILIALRRPIARWIHLDNPQTNVSVDGLLPAGIGILAVYFIASGLISLSRMLGQGWGPVDVAYQQWTGVVSIVLGAVLFISARWISRAFGSRR